MPPNGAVHEWMCSHPRRRELLVLYIVILIVTGLTMYAVLLAAQAAHTQAEVAAVTAARANRLSHQALLRREQVCSLSHQGLPCRELFERLSDSISDRQRRRLACTVIVFLGGPLADRVARDSHCVR